MINRKLRAFLENVKGLISIFGYKNSKRRLEKLPGHESKNSHSSVQDQCVSVQRTADHLLLLYPYRTRASKLDQIRSCEIMSDYDFFACVKQRYRSLHRRLVYWLSFRGLVDVRFVEFRLRRNELADRLKVDAMPPVEEKDNYKYTPMPPEFIPPIGPNEMLHYMDHPEHAPPGADMYSCVPKKLRQRLQVCPDKGYSVGWGIQFIENISYKRISLLVLASIVVSSVLAISWAVLKQDVQTGFTIGTFLLMTLTSGLGSLQVVLEK